MTPADEKPGKIRRFGVKSIDLWPGEGLLAEVTVWHPHRWALWNLAGSLFLTNQRVIFRKNPLALGHGHELRLQNIEQIGQAKLNISYRVGGLFKGWYVQVAGERHYFIPWLLFDRGWLEKLQTATGLPLGEPRAPYD